MRTSDVPVALEGVSKSFGGRVAVDGMDLRLERGRIHGLLGPNGSGKTTTIRMILGILLPDRGRVELLGGPPDPERRSRVGYLPEERGLYTGMRVLDLLVFLGELRRIRRAEAARRARRWLERLGLDHRAGSRVDELSRGMQQKVQFVGTVLHDPELLVLDEPFSGLDPLNQDLLEAIVRELRDGGATVLFSTHLMDQAERLCERVCLMAGGRPILEGELSELRAAERSGAVAVRFRGPREWLEAPGVASVEETGEGVHLLLRPGTDPQELLRAAVEAGAEVLRFELVEPRLHEIFVRHAGAAGERAPRPGVDGASP